MKLEFPLANGGVAYGLADAGIETFEGNYSHYVVRECIQNSLDANHGDDSPVSVTFRHRRFSPDQLPFFDQLKTAIHSCNDKWKGGERENRFFKEAKLQLNSDHIDILEISDSATTGVRGSDFDLRAPWSALVKSRGNSVQNDEGSAGAFGIGKDAPLAASAFRTVLYSTKTLSGKVAFQGVCRLATHTNKEGRETQQTGFIGGIQEQGHDTTYVALRDEISIPPMFQREDVGLSIWVIGFRYGADKWQENFTASAIANFWPAILSQKLTVTFGSNELNAENLAKQLDKYKYHPDVKKQLPFIRSHLVPTKTYKDEVNVAGDSTLKVITGPDLPRRICLTRKSGMVIGSYRPQGLILPFAGIYQCNDNRGNKLLKNLEPPTHDKWDPSRAKSPEEKSIYPAIKDWIRSKLNELNPAMGKDSFDEDGITQYIAPDEIVVLPDDSEALGGESLEPTPPTGSAYVTPSKITPVLTITTQEGGGDQDGDSGGGEGSETDNPQEGDGKDTGGRAGTSGSSGSGADPSTAKGKIKSIRAFSSDGGDTYHVVLRGEADGAINLLVFAHSDDGRSNSLAVKHAQDNESGEEYLVSGDLIREIPFAATGQPKHLVITLTNPGKYSIGARIK